MRPTLLCLHGWGGSKASFTPLREALADLDLEILTPDLPGFGEEKDPAKPWTVDHYAGWVTGWLTTERKSTGPLWILGHSHGGRTAIVLASKNVLPIDHLFLCAPSINRKHRYLLRRTIGVMLATSGKFFLSLPGLRALTPLARHMLYRILRVHDYERASPVMQRTLVLVTKNDLSPLLPDIPVPVDLFWGEDDRQTPVSDAAYMQSLLPRCNVHIYPGTRHAVHKTNAREIAAVVRQRFNTLR